MEGQKKNKNLLSQVFVDKNGVGLRVGVITLVRGLMQANSTKSDFLKIEKLNVGIHNAFLLVKEKEFKKSANAFAKAEARINELFDHNSFEFYCCQLLYLPGKSYLEFKKGKRDYAISLTQKSIEYAVILQNYPSSHDIGFYISQMLDNLARLYLASNEIDEWHKIVLENIHFLANGHCPSYCEDFKLPHNFDANPYRLFMLFGVINNTITSIVRHKLATKTTPIDSISLENTSEPLIAQIDIWIKLNRLLTKQKAETESFEIAYNEFSSYENSKYGNLKILKVFLKYRIKKENVQLHSYKQMMPIA